MSTQPDPVPAPRRTRRSARTRVRILEAAVEVFARRGFHGARVADIAERAGIAYGLVYHHFRNKDEILVAVFSERWDRYVRFLDELTRSADPFRDRLARLAHYWVETYREEPHATTVMINEVSRSNEFLESHDVGSVLAAFDKIAELVEGARRSGEVRADVDPAMAAYAMLGVAEMILTGYVIGTLRRTTREEYRRDEERITALLHNGLAPG